MQKRGGGREERKTKGRARVCHSLNHPPPPPPPPQRGLRLDRVHIPVARPALLHACIIYISKAKTYLLMTTANEKCATRIEQHEFARPPSDRFVKSVTLQVHPSLNTLWFDALDVLSMACMTQQRIKTNSCRYSCDVSSTVFI